MNELGPTIWKVDGALAKSSMNKCQFYLRLRSSVMEVCNGFVILLLLAWHVNIDKR